MSAVTDCLKSILADSYLLYLKTQNFHWNVTGINFYSLHKMFEEQYQELALAVDEIAEQIRTLGEIAPGSLHEYTNLSSIKESDKTSGAKEMLQVLSSDHKLLIDKLKKLRTLAAEHDDSVSEDLAIRRLAVHEKTLWMINASLD